MRAVARARPHRSNRLRDVGLAGCIGRWRIVGLQPIKRTKERVDLPCLYGVRDERFDGLGRQQTRRLCGFCDFVSERELQCRHGFLCSCSGRYFNTSLRWLYDPKTGYATEVKHAETGLSYLKVDERADDGQLIKRIPDSQADSATSSV